MTILVGLKTEYGLVMASDCKGYSEGMEWWLQKTRSAYVEGENHGAYFSFTGKWGRSDGLVEHVLKNPTIVNNLTNPLIVSTNGPSRSKALLMALFYRPLQKFWSKLDSHSLVMRLNGQSDLIHCYGTAQVEQVETYIALGAGRLFARPVLKEGYSSISSIDDQTELALKAIDVCLVANPEVFSGVHIAIVTEEGGKVHAKTGQGQSDRIANVNELEWLGPDFRRRG